MDGNHVGNAFNRLNMRTVERMYAIPPFLFFKNKCLEGEIVDEYDEPVKRWSRD